MGASNRRGFVRARARLAVRGIYPPACGALLAGNGDLDADADSCDFLLASRGSNTRLAASRVPFIRRTSQHKAATALR